MILTPRRARATRDGPAATERGSRGASLPRLAVLLAALGLAAAAAPARAAELIEESFEAAPARFAAAGGTWGVTAGEYAITVPCAPCKGPNGNRAIHDTLVTGDFTLSVDARALPETSADDVSVIFGYRDPANYDFVSLGEVLDATTGGIFRVKGGVLTRLAPVKVAATAGAVAHLKVVRAGTAVRFYRNGEPLAQATDGSFAAGRVGLGSRDNRAVFDNLVVQAGAAPASEEVLVGADAYHVRWIRHDGFNGTDLATGWTKEGTSAFAEKSGRLNVTGLGSQATLWSRRADLPADLIVRYRFAAGKEAGNARNFNQFSHARETDGTSPVGRGAGVYCTYQAITNYLATFTFDHAKLRRDPIPAGLGCPTEDPAVVKSVTTDAVAPGVEYAVTYTVQGGHVRYYVDGRLMHDWTDPAPLPAGFFALRTFGTNGWWDDIEFGALVP